MSERKNGSKPSARVSPALIHLDPAIWSLQGRLWPNFANLWQFGAILSPPGAP